MNYEVKKKDPQFLFFIKASALSRVSCCLSECFREQNGKKEGRQEEGDKKEREEGGIKGKWKVPVKEDFFHSVRISRDFISRANHPFSLLVVR